jgi:uncharacterized membrane protein YGL010W
VARLTGCWVLKTDRLAAISRPAFFDVSRDRERRNRATQEAASTPRELGMTDYFRRQLIDYTEAHRDHVNGVMHAIGNPIIFIGVVMPLSLVPVTVLGFHTSLAPLLVVPALLLWMAWDVGLGLGIAVASVPLLWIASAIAANVGLTWMWIIAVSLFVLGWCLQIVGHQMFEGKRPTALNNPVQSLIAPMYMVAKLYIALGFRADLATIVQTSPGEMPVVAPLFPIEGGADAGGTP